MSPKLHGSNELLVGNGAEAPMAMGRGVRDGYREEIIS